MKKNTYAVTMRHSCGTCGGYYEARTPIGAIAQAVLQYNHLGVKFNTILSVTKEDK